jgi:Transposase DDE domain
MVKTKKKIRNWNEYNKSLVKRGQILLSFDEDYIEHLYYKTTQRRGGRCIYSSQMYEYLLTIKVMLRLPWRATIGFAQAMLQKAFPAQVIQVPDYAHASREARKLELKIKSPGLKTDVAMELAFDSTGVNVYSTSGYHQRNHGKEALCRKREQWKKIHIVLELNSMQIVAMSYTSSRVNDCEVVKELCGQIKGDITSTRADGAYDTNEFYELLHERQARILIPPAVTSKAQDELKKQPKTKKNYLEQRDEAIHWIRQYESFENGLKQWKIASGYHRRSLIEATMFRLKRIFGFHLHHKTEQGRINEIIVKINLLNQMAALGKAAYFD